MMLWPSSRNVDLSSNLAVHDLPRMMRFKAARLQPRKNHVCILSSLLCMGRVMVWKAQDVC